MKKILLRVLIVIAAVLVLFIVVNQFDAGLTGDLYTAEEVPPASLEKDNGFYLVWGFGEAPDVDITSDAVIAKYRKMFDNPKAS